MAIASQAEISAFLYKFKFFAQVPGCFVFVERDKNMQSLAELGITIPQAKNTILQLAYTNYSSGPEDDRDYPGRKVWVFGDHIDAEEVYIKLSNDLSSNIAKCISFHKADCEIIYPYRREV